ncbi:MAG: hypothetical protein COA52_01260 [Hyphomicrobiales bacterium]|nr:MAG: hypothetical protein COA52_00170 [Hyphomicrobiales bacterium]PCJ96861.1 MAG: hypothetical protein COA52_01260 [Hyphomicrobiales bacterium]
MRNKFYPPAPYICFKTFEQIENNHTTVLPQTLKRVCSHCLGKGLDYDENERDPYEGYKLCVRKVPCDRCGGTGVILDKFLKDKWKEIKKKNKQRMKAWKKNIKEIDKILNKLSDDEIEVIGKYVR